MKHNALVFCGLIGYSEGGKGFPLNPAESFKTFQKHVIDSNNGDVDIFIHTWSNAYTQTLQDTFKPVSLMIDAPRFPENSMKSCWYSMKQVLQSVRNYENLMQQKYERILLIRMDLFLFSDFHFQQYDPDKVYVLRGYHRDHWASGLGDYYFLSGSDHIYKLAKLFDSISEEYPTIPHNTIAKFIHNTITENIELDKRLYYDMQMVRRIWGVFARTDINMDYLVQNYGISLEYLQSLPIDTA